MSAHSLYAYTPPILEAWHYTCIYKDYYSTEYQLLVLHVKSGKFEQFEAEIITFCFL